MEEVIPDKLRPNQEAPVDSLESEAVGGATVGASEDIAVGAATAGALDVTQTSVESGKKAEEAVSVDNVAIPMENVSKKKSAFTKSLEKEETFPVLEDKTKTSSEEKDGKSESTTGLGSTSAVGATSPKKKSSRNDGNSSEHIADDEESDALGRVATGVIRPGESSPQYTSPDGTHAKPPKKKLLQSPGGQPSEKTPNVILGAPRGIRSQELGNSRPLSGSRPVSSAGIKKLTKKVAYQEDVDKGVNSNSRLEMGHAISDGKPTKVKKAKSKKKAEGEAAGDTNSVSEGEESSEIVSGAETDGVAVVKGSSSDADNKLPQSGYTTGEDKAVVVPQSEWEDETK